MNENIDDMPGVISIMQEAEKKILEHTGTEVILQISAIHLKGSRKKLLQQIISRYFGISWSAIESQNRKREIVNARHCYMYLLRVAGYSLMEIGNDCGARDHTTVLAAVNKVKGFYQVNDELIDDVEALKKIIKKEIYHIEKV